jgi:hypothetical protein
MAFATLVLAKPTDLARLSTTMLTTTAFAMTMRLLDVRM